ncbi:MAG: TIGR03792 family protein [Limimaricola sp.]|uniref:TIGR03792 family protein n=1 Tax=Limimaricola sp. TaxID=2211665 RepID=UPI001DC78FA4|nr:TIGR03792 family protein [Limimaricola sp.]MBI1415802.1 TIGR03792 family protein [Limimaricola sp.]
MVIEHLTVRVPLSLQAAYLANDAAIWTATLAAQPGFISKETWRDAATPEMLHLIIRWASRDQWKAVPRATLEATESAFAAALGQSIPIQSCTDLDVLTPVA